eukprot:scaffold34596_cov222-Amphora_coffeaeformis.AAC.15
MIVTVPTNHTFLTAHFSTALLSRSHFIGTDRMSSRLLFATRAVAFCAQMLLFWNVVLWYYGDPYSRGAVLSYRYASHASLVDLPSCRCVALSLTVLLRLSLCAVLSLCRLVVPLSFRLALTSDGTVALTTGRSICRLVVVWY